MRKADGRKQRNNQSRKGSAKAGSGGRQRRQRYGAMAMKWQLRWMAMDGNDGDGARLLLVGAVLPGGGVSKLPLRGRDTGLEGQEQQCRHRTACGGAVGNVIVVDCTVKHLPRPHLRSYTSWPRWHGGGGSGRRGTLSSPYYTSFLTHIG